jgi:gamma-glutamyltranspeptidase/glutathione hydrolase
MIQTRPEIRGTFGVVASTHWIASATGMAVLEAGGNAFDAAVACGFVMQVVEPHLSGPAGDLSALVWNASEGRPYEVCGQGVAPARASTDAFRGYGLDLIPGSGMIAATVPGAFAGWLTMLQRWGTWELEQVLSYALHYAEGGFPLLPGTTAAIDGVQTLFTDHWPTSAEVWLADGSVPTANTRWRLPKLAETYRRILSAATGPSRDERIESARRAFYEGFVAEAIDTFGRTPQLDGSGRAHAALLTGDDLAAWRPSVDAPLAIDFAGEYGLLKTGVWGQGPVLGQQLRLFEAAGLFELPARSAEWIHVVVEAAKLAYADREAWYGDPLFSDVALTALLSREYAAERALLIGHEASLQLRPGSPAGVAPRLADLSQAHVDELMAAAASGASGEPTVGQFGPADGDTCHVDIVDRFGNFVSATPSGGWLQSSPAIPELGFALGTRAQMFYLDEGLPNSLRPGARPRTTLSPSIALKNGEPWMAFGTPGGDQQDQWQAVFLADVVQADRSGGANLQAAIDAPMFNSMHAPSSFYPRDAHPGELVIEARIGATIIQQLTERGHRVTPVGDWSLGRLSAVVKDDFIRGAANPRGAQGYAVGR